MIYVIIVVLIDILNCIILNIKDVAVGKTKSYYLNSSSYYILFKYFTEFQSIDSNQINLRFN